MSRVESSPWLLRRPVPAPRIRLYCFCYAGGNAASFVNWQPLIDQRIEICAVQLPGRGSRFTEKPFDDLGSLIAVLTNVLAQQPAMPFAFFGHSLGGLLAFEVTRAMRNAGQALPLHLFVSGCSAPRYRSPSKGYHRLDDDALLAVLQQYNGTPPDILAHRELMALLLPTIRADFALVEKYAYREEPLLNVPMTVLGGKVDAAIESPQQIHGWLEETSAPGRVRWFKGDHFFIHSEQHAVLDCLVSELVRLI
jgi:medium-chain acyl-[acyl-carrier-protein] hydrolase